MKLVIWKKKDNSFYYKLVYGTYTKYYVGKQNQYKHEVVFIIDNIIVIRDKVSFKTKCIKRLIRFLQKKL